MPADASVLLPGRRLLSFILSLCRHKRRLLVMMVGRQGLRAHLPRLLLLTLLLLLALLLLLPRRRSAVLPAALRCISWVSVFAAAAGPPPHAAGLLGETGGAAAAAGQHKACME